MRKGERKSLQGKPRQFNRPNAILKPHYRKALAAAESNAYLQRRLMTAADEPASPGRKLSPEEIAQYIKDHS